MQVVVFYRRYRYLLYRVERGGFGGIEVMLYNCVRGKAIEEGTNVRRQGGCTDRSS